MQINLIQKWINFYPNQWTNVSETGLEVCICISKLYD